MSATSKFESMTFINKWEERQNFERDFSFFCAPETKELVIFRVFITTRDKYLISCLGYEFTARVFLIYTLILIITQFK